MVFASPEPPNAKPAGRSAGIETPPKGPAGMQRRPVTLSFVRLSRDFVPGMSEGTRSLLVCCAMIAVTFALGMGLYVAGWK